MHLARVYPYRRSSHLVMDNYATHKRPEIKASGWKAYPRIHVHFTPTSGPWLNLVEVLVRHHRTPSHPPWRLSLPSAT